MKALTTSIQFIIWLAVVVFFGFLIYLNWAPQGVTYVKDFTRPGEHKFVTDLTPGNRVSQHTQLLTSPVYWHIRSPRRFDAMEIEFTGSDFMQTNEPNEFRIAVQVGPQREVFSLYPFLTRSSSDATIVLPLHDAYRDREGKYTLIFSFEPQLQPIVEHATIRLYDL